MYSDAKLTNYFILFGHLFYLWDYITRRFEKLDFQQKEKEEFQGFIGEKRPSHVHLRICVKVTY